MAISIEIRPEDVKLHSTAIKFLPGLQATKHLALFRGAFTKKIAKLHGYHYGIETGCPTLKINHNVHLGLSLNQNITPLAKGLAIGLSESH